MYIVSFASTASRRGRKHEDTNGDDGTSEILRVKHGRTACENGSSMTFCRPILWDPRRSGLRTPRTTRSRLADETWVRGVVLDRRGKRNRSGRRECFFSFFFTRIRILVTRLCVRYTARQTLMSFTRNRCAPWLLSRSKSALVLLRLIRDEVYGSRVYALAFFLRGIRRADPAVGSRAEKGRRHEPVVVGREVSEKRGTGRSLKTVFFFVFFLFL